MHIIYIYIYRERERDAANTYLDSRVPPDPGPSAGRGDLGRACSSEHFFALPVPQKMAAGCCAQSPY